jgi:hypothetical protein
MSFGARCGRYVVLIAMICVRVGHSQAQTVSGTISGFVRDQQEAAVPAASVITRSTQTGLTLSTISGEDGHYRIQNIPPGEHIVEITAAGFRTFRSIPVSIGVSEPLRLDVKLLVDNVTESLTVEATTARVNTEDNQLGATVREVSRLPVLSAAFGRSPLDLLALTAGTTRNLPGTQPGLGSFNGQRVYSNNTMLDGAYANNQVNNTADLAALYLSPNAVAEIRAVTGVMKAEFGRNSGSAIVITTKSGQNDLHGIASESFRNTNLNAGNFFLKAVPGGTPESLPNGAPRNPAWNSNDFDANLGGPIRRNETFFFVSYLGLRQHHAIVRSAVVPNDAERTIIESQGIPAAKSLLNLVPRATFGNTLLSSPENRVRGDEILGKLDHAITLSNRFSATYFIVDATSTLPFSNVSVPGFGANYKDRQQNVVIRDSQFFSRQLINELRIAFTRTASNDSQPQNRTKLADLGLRAIIPANPAAEGPPYVAISGLDPFGSALYGPQLSKLNNVQILENLSHDSHRHSLKLGGEFRTFAVNSTFDIAPNGSIVSDGRATVASPPLVRAIPGLRPALNDFANGFATLFQQTSSSSLAHRAHSVSLFIQDDWRIVSRLSINVGLRWEINTPYTDLRDRIVSFHPGVQSQVFPNAPVGLVFPGDPGVSRSTYKLDLNDFSPRFGFAWDVQGNGKLSLRGGFAVQYDTPFDEILSGVSQTAPPYSIAPSTTATDYTNPWSGSLLNPTTQPFPFEVPRPGDRVDFRKFAPISFTFLDSSFRTPYVQLWNLQIQRQLPKDWLLEIGYVGNGGRKLSNEGEYNYALPNSTATKENTNARRILNLGNALNIQFNGAVFGSIKMHRGNANSSYDGMQFQVSHRLGNGFYMTHGYTWSHTIDDASGRRVSSRPDPKQDRGNSEIDIRHNYTMGYVYELPFFRARASKLGHILGGWGFSGRTAFTSGYFVSVNESDDRCLCATGNQRADATGRALVYLEPRSTVVAGRPNSWFDGTGGGSPTAAENLYFRRVGSGQSAAEGAGRYGNAGRNTIRTPGINEWNAAVFKRIAVLESHFVEIRSEFYNALNHANFRPPNVDIGSVNFGIISETRDPRIIQFVAKYEF